MILFSDLHLEEKSEPYALEVLKRVGDEARARGEKHVVFLGDFFMVRHVLPVRLILAARDVMRSWFAPMHGDPGIERFDVVPGNHDQTNVDGRNALEVFDGLSGGRTHVHTEPTWTQWGLMVPWRSDADRFIAGVQLPRPPDADNVLFAHAAMKGAMRNNTKMDDDGIDSETFAGLFRRTFLGHYHKHQLVRKGMLYVGSGFQTSYAEAGQPKGFVTWDGTKHTHVEWDIGPRHHKLVLDADNPAAFMLPPSRPGDKLWVQCKGQMAGTMRDVVAQAVARTGLEIDRLDIDLQPVEATARLELKAGEAPADTAKRFVDAQEVAPDYKTMLMETWSRLNVRGTPRDA